MKSKDILNSFVLGGSGGSSPAPSGSVTFTQNGTYDVSDKAEAVVDVPTPTPSGSVTITENGTYDVSGNAQAVVNVPIPTPAGMSWEELFGGNTAVNISLTDDDVQTDFGGNFYIPKNFANDTEQVGPIGNTVPFRTRFTGLNVNFSKSLSTLVIGSTAFSGCSNLKSLALIAPYPRITVQYNAFTSTGITGAIDMSGVKEIGKDAFASCRNISSVVTRCSNFGETAFRICSAMEQMDVLNQATFAKSVFGGCSSLTALILRSNSLSTISDTTTFTGTPIASGTGYIYVPASVIDAYKEASNWVYFANQFRALEDYTVDGTRTGALDPEKV